MLTLHELREKIIGLNIKRFLLACAIFLSVSLGDTNIQAAPIIVGYYPSWTHDTYPAEKVVYSSLTHIAHAFIWPNSDGTLAAYDNFLYPGLITAAKKAGVKVIVSIGGWGNCAGYPLMAANTTTRRKFIDNVRTFCQTNGYQGVDLDWEYPSTPTERVLFTNLVKEMRESFDQVDKNLTISFVVPSGQSSAGQFDYAALKSAVNWIGCMTYDFHGSWSGHSGHNSPLYAPNNDPEGSSHLSMQYMLAQGILKEKLLMGLAFYGIEFNADRFYAAATGGGQIVYRDIITKTGRGWTYNWDDVAKVPYFQDGAKTKLISFDDSVSIKTKCDYVKVQNYGGVIMWALGQDDLGKKQPLLTAVGRYLNAPTQVENLTAQVPSQTTLLGNYPNPFNNSTQIRYHLANATAVTLEVLNTLGQSLQVIVAGQQDSGWHEVNFNGSTMSSGVYYLKLTAGNQISIQKIALVK